MPLDAICLRAVLHELRPQLIGARIDKVQQPARDQIVLLLRGNLRLLLNAGANQPRIQLTNILRDNPAQPPMFCMLLRKHLVGARVLSIEQPDLERMVILTLQCTDEFGEISQKQLVLECMGRRSNLVLLDAQGRIVECLRRVDADLSATRQLLPGLFYHLPTPLDKLSLLSQEDDSLALAQRGGDGIHERCLLHAHGHVHARFPQLERQVAGEGDLQVQAGQHVGAHEHVARGAVARHLAAV